MEKLESASVHIEQPDSPSPIQCTDPEPMELNPGAALGTLIDFTRESESPAQIIYTLNMKNGDTIRLGMELTIKKTAIYNFSPEDTDLSDSKALQALIDWAEAETEPEDSVECSSSRRHLYGADRFKRTRHQSNWIRGGRQTHNLYRWDPDAEG